MAFQESRELGYCYIALLHAAAFDQCRQYLPAAFDQAEHIRLHLFDHDPSGSLFGFRFRGGDSAE